MPGIACVAACQNMLPNLKCNVSTVTVSSHLDPLHARTSTVDLLEKSHLMLLKGHEATSWPYHTTPSSVRCTVDRYWSRAEGISYFWERSWCQWCWSGTLFPAARPRFRQPSGCIPHPGGRTNGSLPWTAVAGSRAAVAGPGRRSAEDGSRCWHTALVSLSECSSLRLSRALSTPHTRSLETRAGALRRAGCGGARASGAGQVRPVPLSEPPVPAALVASLLSPPQPPPPRPRRSPGAGRAAVRSAGRAEAAAAGAAGRRRRGSGRAEPGRAGPGCAGGRCRHRSRSDTARCGPGAPALPRGLGSPRARTALGPAGSSQSRSGTGLGRARSYRQGAGAPLL